MSRDKSEWIQAAAEAFNADPFATLVDFVAPDVEFRQFGDVFGTAGGTHNGHDAVANAISPFFGAFEDFQAEVIDVVDAGGDAMVVGLRHTGLGRASGVKASIDLFHVLRVREGKLYSWHVHRTKAEALEAVGLRE